MQNSYSPDILRRSSRVPVNVPILVTSLEPGARFSEVCETLVVNAHGCSMRSHVKLDAGVLVHFHSKDGRETTATVVYCQPLDSEREGWRLAARLDRPENFWGLEAFPKDWAKLPAVAELSADMLPAKVMPKNVQTISPPVEKIPASLKTILDNLHAQVADERLRALVAEAVKPLLTQMAELHERLARAEQPRERSKFEVSLSHIPPEVQNQVELRLRKELGPRVLDEARSQSAQVLQEARSAIQQTTSESHAEFRQKVSEDLRSVEQRVHGVSEEVVENLRDQARRQMGEFHQHVVDAGNRLKRLSEELLDVQQRKLGNEHDARRNELEQLQAAVTSESSRLQAEIADLDGRIAKLDESVRGLESGLDIRLSKMASNTVSGARTQLENTVDVILDQLGSRSTQKLEHQVEQAGARLGIIQKEIENAVSESVRMQAAGMLQAFEQSLDELARSSVERCRTALAGGLSSLVRSLGDQFQLEPTSNHGREYGRPE
jgi:hypothetical protein